MFATKLEEMIEFDKHIFLQRGCLNHHPFSESESLPASYTSIEKNGIMLTTPKSHPFGTPQWKIQVLA